MDPPCVVCSHPQGEEITDALAAGTLTVHDAANMLGTDFDTVWTHFQKHLRVPKKTDVPTSIPGETISVDEMISTLTYLLGRLRARVDLYLSGSAIGENDRTAAQLVRELRGLTTDIALLQGKLSNLPLQKIDDLTKSIESINSFMATELCDSCKLRLAEKIGETSGARKIQGIQA